MDEIRHLLAEGRVLIIDGGMGSLLQARGMPAGINPAVFCLDRPDVVRGIHQAYAEAGADILLSATFGGSSFKLPASMDVIAFNRAMAGHTRAVAVEMSAKLGRRIFAAGDIGPIGHFLAPLGDVEPEQAVEALRAQIRGLVQGGAELLFIETQFDLAEVRAAVAAARLECDLPVFVSMTFEDGVSLTGTTPEIFAATMRNMGVDAVGVNCGAGPEQLLAVAERLLAACDLPVFAEPNAGLPELIGGETVFRLEPEPFAEKTAAFAERGIQLLGGCCGTTPAHIAALRRAVRPGERSGRQQVPAGVTLTTRSSLVRIGGDEPLALIGERINPTGKKLLSAEFQNGRTELAMRYAQEQIDAGVRILDVNVGAPGVVEEEFLPELTRRLVAKHGTPLCLDSSNASALARAVPYHPGSALLNSISGEPGRLEQLGPLCRAWGAPFVLLPLKGRQLPVSAAERISIIQELLEQILAMGIPRHLILVDVLALTAASDAGAPAACLDTARWCAAQGLPTTIGLSNISFGLPARDLVNSTFLAMAAGAGLSSCIGNPGNARLREAVDAANLLLGRDPQAGRFIAAYADWQNGGGATPLVQAAQANAGSLSPITLEEAVIRGEKDAVIGLVEAALAEGADPFALVRERLIPAINEVGLRYERKEYFLPQLLRSAETMQTAFARVRPLLEATRGKEERSVVLLATVEGDIHDIGKNIVALLLGNHGYEVVDLGKDVKASVIVEEAVRRDARLIGLSALMTTTMPRMEETIHLVRARKPDCRVMVGGAVVTPEYASTIDADGYAADAVEAVRLAARLLGSKT